ncbi:MAG: class I SAM-dependent methyltransferase [Candidatus Omnitrophota bacterium]
MSDYRQKFYSRYVSTYQKGLFEIENCEIIKKSFPVFHKYYVRHFPEDKGASILELGCGNGAFLYYLQHLGYCNSYGIDISQEQINIAKRIRVNNAEKADLREYLKDKKNSYDVIIGRDILEHFSKNEIMDVLQLIYDSLKTGGMLIIQTPNGESPFSNRYRYCDITHEIIFTRISLQQLLSVFDFKDVLCYRTGPVVYGLKSAVRFVLWRFIELFLKAYLLIESGTCEGVFTQNIICKARKGDFAS